MGSLDRILQDIEYSELPLEERRKNVELTFSSFIRTLDSIQYGDHDDSQGHADEIVETLQDLSTAVLFWGYDVGPEKYDSVIDLLDPIEDMALQLFENSSCVYSPSTIELANQLVLSYGNILKSHGDHFLNFGLVKYYQSLAKADETHETKQTSIDILPIPPNIQLQNGRQMGRVYSFVKYRETGDRSASIEDGGIIPFDPEAARQTQMAGAPELLDELLDAVFDDDDPNPSPQKFNGEDPIIGTSNVYNIVNLRNTKFQTASGE